MEIREIVKDSIKYSLSDWKKILILGSIVVISNISDIGVSLGTTNVAVICFLGIFGFIIGLLGGGYLFRIIKSSLVGIGKLPTFDDWIDMFIDGSKMFIVIIVYLIPANLVMLIFLAFYFGPTFTLVFGTIGLNPLAVIGILLGWVVWPGIWVLIGISYDMSLIAPAGISGFINILYIIIMIPIILMAMANMAKNNSKLSAAFRFHEILDKIAIIGWKKLLMWYIVSGILFLILFALENVIFNIFISINLTIVLTIIGQVFFLLILVPYFYMYFARSIALFYMSE